MVVQPGWVEDASADNAETTATKAAETDQQHFIYAVTASFDNTAQNKLLQLKDGATVIWSAVVSEDRPNHFTFPAGLPGSKGNAVSATLAASGTGGTTGYVNLHGATF